MPPFASAAFGPAYKRSATKRRYAPDAAGFSPASQAGLVKGQPGSVQGGNAGAPGWGWSDAALDSHYGAPSGSAAAGRAMYGGPTSGSFVSSGSSQSPYQGAAAGGQVAAGSAHPSGAYQYDPGAGYALTAALHAQAVQQAGPNAYQEPQTESWNPQTHNERGQSYAPENQTPGGWHSSGVPNWMYEQNLADNAAQNAAGGYPGAGYMSGSGWVYTGAISGAPNASWADASIDAYYGAPPGTAAQAKAQGWTGY